MKKSIVLIPLLIFLNYCKNISTNTELDNCPVNIEVGIDELNNNILDSSVLFDTIWSIQLEAIPESLISNCFRLISWQNRLIIFDYKQQCVFIFDKKGKFIHKINDRGNGPKEYNNLEDVHLSFNNEIVLLDATRDGLLYYDLNGNFLKNEKVSSNIKACVNLRKLSDDFTAYYTAKLTNDKTKVINHNLIIEDRNDKMTFWFDNENESEIKVMAPDNYLFRNSIFEVFYQNPFKNVIYRIKDGVPHCELKVNLDKGSIPDKAFYTVNPKQFNDQYYLNKNYFLMIGSFQSTLNHFIIPIFNAGEIAGNIIVSRLTFEKVAFNKIHYKNDNRYLYIRATEGNTIISIEDDYNTMVTGAKYEDIDMISNPRVVFYTLKKF